MKCLNKTTKSRVLYFIRVSLAMCNLWNRVWFVWDWLPGIIDSDWLFESSWTELICFAFFFSAMLYYCILDINSKIYVTLNDPKKELFQLYRFKFRCKKVRIVWRQFSVSVKSPWTFKGGFKKPVGQSNILVHCLKYPEIYCPCNRSIGQMSRYKHHRTDHSINIITHLS